MRLTFCGLVAAAVLAAVLAAAGAAAQPPAPAASDAQLSKEVWDAWYESAARVGDDDRAATALLQLAQHYPGEIAGFRDKTVLATIASTARLKDGAERQYALLDALFDSGWKPSDPDLTMDSHWADLAAGLVEHGRAARAGEVARTVRDPWTLAYMRADRRFDTLFDHASPDFDADARVAGELQFRSDLVSDKPDRLKRLYRYGYELHLTGHPDVALKLYDGALARAAAAPPGKSAFEDPENLVWIMDGRMEVLLDLARRDEALAQEIKASKGLEQGGGNVSQVINLASLYDQLGRPKDALKTLGELRRGTSRYGRMQVEAVRVGAFLQLGDEAGLAHALDYLKAHGEDAPVTLLGNLVAVGDLDAAAAFWIPRLEDPRRRLKALAALQRFAPSPHPTAMGRRVEQGMEALRNRPDMKAAIDKVGRINSYGFRDYGG